MSNLADLRRQLEDSFSSPSQGVVGLVDSLIAMLSGHRLELEWQSGHCVGRIDHTEAIAFRLRKSVFRAILARLAILCNERHPGLVSPYGGEGELSVTASETITRVWFTNTADLQRLELAPATKRPDHLSDQSATLPKAVPAPAAQDTAASEAILQQWLDDRIAASIGTYALSNELLVNDLWSRVASSELWKSVRDPLSFFLTAGLAVRDFLRSEAARARSPQPQGNAPSAPTSHLMHPAASTTGYGHLGQHDPRYVLSLEGARFAARDFDTLDTIIVERSDDDNDNVRDALLLYYFAGRSVEQIVSLLTMPGSQVLDIIAIVRSDFTEALL
jgi:hypothetical protein